MLFTTMMHTWLYQSVEILQLGYIDVYGRYNDRFFAGVFQADIIVSI